MQVSDFIERLASKYEKPAKYDIEDLKNWILKEGLTEKDIDKLYDELIYTFPYNYFPKMHHVFKAWERIRPLHRDDDFDYSSSEKNIIDGWYKWDLKQILKKLQEIRKKINNSEATFTDKTFYHEFDVILTEYNYMKEKEFEKEVIKSHLQYVFNCLEGGRDFKSICEKQEFNLNVNFGGVKWSK